MNFKSFIDLPLKWHLFIGTVVRLSLIVYADYHDNFYDVPYTDVDYKVFTDAARHVVNGNSPYNRHTYRYSPILSYLMIPNILVHKNFGKILFCAFDILITLALKILVADQLKDTSKNKGIASKVGKYSALIWLYNPLSVAISTRGNADSVPCFLIVMSILFLQSNFVNGLVKYALSGLLLGVSIHLRMYPLAFSFPMYLSLGTYRVTRNTTLLAYSYMLIPNRKQVILAATCVGTLVSLTWILYSLYGYDFLFETYIYHAFRKDTRHNFSILFYYNYLTSASGNEILLVKYLIQLFLLVILFVLSVSFGCDSSNLPLALFGQAVVLVAYNSVVTSQYFVWFLSLLPLVAHNFKLKPSRAALMAIVWALPQASWLFYAYLLEFMSREVFLLIWLKSVIFFCANVFVLGQLIKCYSPGYAFGYCSSVKSE